MSSSSTPQNKQFNELHNLYNQFQTQISNISINNNIKSDLLTTFQTTFQNTVQNTVQNNNCKKEIAKIAEKYKTKINKIKEEFTSNNINNTMKKFVNLNIKMYLQYGLNEMFEVAARCMLDKPIHTNKQNHPLYHNIQDTHTRTILLQLVSILHELLPPFKRKEVLEKLQKKKNSLTNMKNTINNEVKKYLNI